MIRRAAARLFSTLRRRRRRVAGAAAAIVLAPFVVLLVMAALTPLPAELRERPAPSVRVLARDGRLLREVRTDDGARSRPLPIAEFPKPVVRAVLAAEDQRFYRHHGIDFEAVARAALANVWHRRIVSGASTITMQLARTVRPHPRSLWGKLREAALALRIEASLSKDEILEQYLNRVIYGPNLRGYAAASQAYLGKSPSELSTAEAALVAGLPRGPSLYQVTKRPELAKRRRDRILARMADAGTIDERTKENAIAEAVPKRLDAPAFGAPHFVHALVTGALGDAPKEHGAIATTIDPELQRAAEHAITSTLASLEGKHVTAAAVIVVENATGDVLAYVGSPDFDDAATLGRNDGVRALRQPGSSLKPFVYAEAMTSLGFTGATLLPDVELHVPLPGGGDYVAHDYDARLRGPVRLREALGNSLNVPAVYTLHRLGTQRVLDRLHAMGFASLTEDAEHYGPALALGDGEVTLLELANGYATLARGGTMRPLRFVRDRPVGPETRVLDERVAAMITDILADKKARLSSFGDQNALELEFDVAAKTGTSKGYRDNVAVGYTRALTVAAWAGNFDGSPMRDVSGIAGAGPIFHAVMEAAVDTGRRRGGPSGVEPGSLSLAADAHRLGLERAEVCAVSGEIPTSACPHRVREWLPEGDAEHAPPCSVHVRMRVDLRNGLRAGPACGPDVADERVFEAWAPPFDAWAKETGRPRAPEASSPECPVADAPDALDALAPTERGAPRVTYPFDGARFVIDPERPIELQTLDVQVEPAGARTVVRIDGAPLAASLAWPLAPGAHTVVAETAGRASPPVHFSVR